MALTEKLPPPSKQTEPTESQSPRLPAENDLAETQVLIYRCLYEGFFAFGDPKLIGDGPEVADD